ncbi:hypothetical protein [Halomonas rhizosphaerae]|uniref:Uncharacterized protein n=1 Tax=Halomonas rhizosphaerae TaxID=3043296 RepID=A0ABT6UZP7_9GAMM|nr:hypothetical protein [Halomonas rhizosphaerae]MDI5891463.1 hypothetical protein [Halomonas rhizosphaerae]
MNIPTLACELPDAAPEELVEQPFPIPNLPLACIGLEASLARRLAEAKARLDRLEHEVDSRDLSALAMARVEFALAARAMADELIARGLHAREKGD